MKKILIINLVALLFATADMDITTAGKQGLTLYGGKNSGDAATTSANQKLIGKASTGVGIGIISSTLGYAVISQHKSGIKAYGSSHDSTAMYMCDVVAGTIKVAKPSAIGSVDFANASNKWTSM